MNSLNRNINTYEEIINLINSDQDMIQILKIVRDLNLPDCWIGAGFIRNKIWNYIHGYENNIKNNDIDIVYFDSNDYEEIEETIKSTKKEKYIENLLNNINYNIEWSVSNQARMHLFNSDTPYYSSLDAISNRPETATAIAIRIDKNDNIDFKAMYGIDDLVKGIIRPTPGFKKSQEKLESYRNRVKKKGWIYKRPKLQFITE